MPGVKQDRRSERSQQLLLSAFTALLQERRYDAITVQHIIDRANVGRSTFYAHFTDKDDLLVHAFERVLDMLTQELGGEVLTEQVISSTALFEHIQDNHAFYRALVRGRGMELLLEKGQAHVSQIVAERLATKAVSGQEPGVPLAVIAHSVAGSLFLLIKWWLDNQMPYTSQQMDGMFQQLVFPGVWASLGGR